MLFLKMTGRPLPQRLPRNIPDQVWYSSHFVESGSQGQVIGVGEGNHKASSPERICSDGS
jgi:hypothetical protein